MTENRNEITTQPRTFTEGDPFMLPAGASGKFEIEHPDDRAARLSRQALEARDVRLRETIRYWVLLSGYLIALIAVTGVSLFGQEPSTVQFARELLKTMIAGLLGFALRK